MNRGHASNGCSCNNGPLNDVLDPEAEKAFVPKKLQAWFNVVSVGSNMLKCKIYDCPEEITPPQKALRFAPTHEKQNSASLHIIQNIQELSDKPPTAGCTWLEEDWSCAYDAVFMVLLYAFLRADSGWITQWCALAL